MATSNIFYQLNRKPNVATNSFSLQILATQSITLLYKSIDINESLQRFEHMHTRIVFYLLI